MTPTRRCVDCNHSNPNGNTDDETIILECRRYPPIYAGPNPDGAVELMWVQVNPDDWCGCWEPQS